MLKRKRQQIYFAATAASAQKHLDAFCRNLMAEELHRFRVDIKKLRALLTILKKHPANGKLLKAFKPFDRIFKLAGETRTMDVNRKLISGYPSVNNAILETQQLQRNRKALKFIASAVRHKLTMQNGLKKINSLFFDVEDRFLISKSRKYFKKTATSLTKNAGNIDVLHGNRKKLKVLLYSHKLFPKAVAEKLMFNTVYLNKVEHAIGDWHDLVQAEIVLTRTGYKSPGVFHKLDRDTEKQQHRVKKLIKNFAGKAG